MTPGYQNLLRDRSVSVNGRFTSFNGSSTITATDQLGIKYGGKTVQIDAAQNGKAKIGDEEVTFELNKAYDLGRGCSLTYNGSSYVFSGDKEYDTITALDAGAYFNTTIHTSALGVNTDRVTPTGYMGETLDADKVAQTKAKYDPAYYLRENLLDFS